MPQEGDSMQRVMVKCVRETWRGSPGQFDEIKLRLALSDVFIFSGRPQTRILSLPDDFSAAQRAEAARLIARAL
jgi:hypothetical protein